MAKYSIIVAWEDMPIGFKAWLLNLRRNEGIVLRQWSNRKDGVVTGLGFDVNEDSYQNNKTYVEMIKKFKNPQRKTQLKRWIILDNENFKTRFHEE